MQNQRNQLPRSPHQETYQHPNPRPLKRIVEGAIYESQGNSLPQSIRTSHDGLSYGYNSGNNLGPSGVDFGYDNYNNPDFYDPNVGFDDSGLGYGDDQGGNINMNMMSQGDYYEDQQPASYGYYGPGSFGA